MRSIPRVLREVGVTSWLCTTAAELCAEVEKGAGALIIGEDLLSSHAVACLRDALGHQPSWSELPIIVLLHHGPDSSRVQYTLLLPGDVTPIERPVRVNTLVAHVQAALRSRRRQSLVRDQMLELEQAREQLQAQAASLAEANLKLKQVDREREQTLMQQSRLAAMGEMLGNISHQWRQPLNVGLILQNVQMTYAREMLTKESLDKAVSRARELIAHMSQTIDDFRNYLSPEKVKSTFDVTAVVERAVSILGESLQGVQLHLDKPDAPVLVEGYRNEYAQVLINILMNARDVLRDRKIGEPTVLVKVERQGARSVVTIADNAGGIAMEIIDKVFDPYFTTKGPDKGTGIGLFMSKAIIERNMDGSLTVRNTSEGAEFRIEV
jgi:signal transduction histidine kinase